MKISKANIKNFVNKWTGRGREDEDDRSYWIDLFQVVFEQTGVTDRLFFQKKVTGRDGNTKRIDVYIPETKVIIEQKSLGIALDKPQAGHDGMTPYEQALMYNDGLPYSEKARWIVTSNFAEIWIYDLDKRKPEEDIVKVYLDKLDTDYSMLQFLFDNKVEEIRNELRVSQEAGDRIGNIYDALLAQIPGEPTEEEYKSLNLFCVRLVFCYYAEDAGLFGKYQFRDYMKGFNTRHLRNGLKDLFRILDTKESERDRNDEPELLDFPYVNGGLFADRNIIIPQIDEKTHELMTQTSDFNWSEISPTIFGAVFESTLNQETRRKGGMHYTSIENIHKVIDPLFLDKLKEEYQTISESKQPNVKRQKLKEYQEKLGSLKFLDPACGSGNFLTETYLSLRKIENEVIKDITELDRSVNPNQIAIGDFAPGKSIIKVNLNQFYGIEINDFAVSVAKTALWIAENQMLKQTEDIAYQQIDFLPLKSYVNIVEGNALRIDWGKVIDPSHCSYIMGNPPFLGANNTSTEQKADLAILDPKNKKTGLMDYVCGWYIKAAQYVYNTKIKCAFVSTNSITQGEQVAILWSTLKTFGIHINFAYRSFIWDSEASIKAHVHCVIICFSTDSKTKKYIYTSQAQNPIEASNINAYLLDTIDVYLDRLKHPLCDVPEIEKGNQPTDGGHLIIEPDQYDEFISKEPSAKKYIKRLMGAQEYINNTKRYCLWLVGITPSELRSMPLVYERVQKCREDRLNGGPDKIKLANRPAEFRETKNPRSYIIIPSTTSENREYVPVGFLHEDTIPTNANLIIIDATLYHLGVLASNVHMAWMRAVCGRLEMRYRYSKEIVYNNFPWPTPSDDQKTKIEKTAQAILDARDLYPDSSLADLYDPLTMPIELRKAHEANDKAVMKAYGFEANMEESEIVAELMKMYQRLTET